MPYVNVRITREGDTSAEKKAAIIAGMTRVLEDVLGKDPTTTFVVIDEVELESWGVGGEPVEAYRRRRASASDRPAPERLVATGTSAEAARSAARTETATRAQTRASSATKTAVLVLSDPDAGSEEALGRLFNALAATYDFKQRGDDVTLVFLGTGTRWARELTRPEHPAHALFEEVADRVAGVSGGCADIFGATEGAEEAGVTVIRECAVPGTNGVPSLRDLVDAGYSLVTF